MSHGIQPWRTFLADTQEDIIPRIRLNKTLAHVLFQANFHQLFMWPSFFECLMKLLKWTKNQVRALPLTKTRMRLAGGPARTAVTTWGRIPNGRAAQRPQRARSMPDLNMSYGSYHRRDFEAYHLQHPKTSKLRSWGSKTLVLRVAYLLMRTVAPSRLPSPGLPTALN